MKRKFLLFTLITFLTFGLAGCDLLLSILGQVTTTIETTESTDTTDTTTIDTITSFDTTTPVVTTTTGATTSGATTTVTTDTTTTTVQQYTVIFYDYDGTTVLKTEVVTAGGNATPPAEPTRASTDQFSFVFSGWTGSYTNVTGNATVLATYTATIRQYTVTFYDEDGTTVLGASTVNYGTAATAPATPSKTDTAQWDYTFAGWNAAFTNVVANQSVLATYTAALRQYTVTFYDEDGTSVLGASTVDYGTAATAPVAPSKPDTAQWDYTFAGWNATFTNVVANQSVLATYIAALRQYTVTFYDEDGITVLGTSIVDYGTAAVAPVDPTKPSSAQFDYEFSGWNGDFDDVRSAFSVLATYAASTREYTVVFFDADGTELKSEDVLYGEAATAPADPVKPSTPQFDYVFTGWDLSFDPITGDLSVHAVYAEILREYLVTFYDDDGFTVLGIETVDYGASATPPAAPAKGASAEATYSFSHWEGDFTEITGDASVVAVYTEHRFAFHVRFVDIDGTVIDAQLVNLGADAVAPADPVRPDTAQYAYTFTGWLGDFTGVDADCDIYAQYDVVVQMYVVDFYSEDGLELLGSSTVAYGHPAVPPVSPEKLDYYFVGWSEGVAYVTRDMIVYAVFSNVVWNRQLLLDYLATWHDETPTPEQLEADVVMLLDVLGLDPLDPLAERQAYELMQVFQGFLENLMNAETLAEIQEAYTNAKASGFDRDRVIGVLLGVLEQNLADGIDYSRVDEILAQIAWLEQMIVDTEAQKAAAFQDGIDYCIANGGANAAQCQLAWAVFVEESFRYHVYNDLLETYTFELYNGVWNWDVWFNLQWFMDDILYYTFADPDTYNLNLNLAAYNEYMDGLSIEEQAMYGTVMTAYSSWKSYQYSDGNPMRNMVMPLDDIYGYSIGDTLFNEYLSAYDQLFWDIGSYEWHIVELQWQLDDAYAELEMLVALQGYIASEAGYAKAEILVGTLYDVFESVLYGIDEGTFNLIYGLATGMIDPTTLGTDAADLLGYLDRATALIRLFLSSVETDDVENLKSIARDIFGLYIDAQDMTLEDAAVLTALFATLLDEYVQIAEDVYGELLTVLDSLDEAKIQVILDQIAILQQRVIYRVDGSIGMEGFDLRQIIAIAKIVDILANESGVDAELLAGHFVKLYYDLNYEFVYDDAERLAVTAALQDSVDRILELVHIVAGFDDGAMPNPAQLELLMELRVRIEAIAQAFGGGWPAYLLEADYSTYNHEMFVDLIYQMNDWNISDDEAEAQIAMIVATFETDEQTTYFILLSFANAFRTIGKNPSLTAIADFYFGLGAMGYDNATIARLLTNFAVNMIEYKLVYSDAEEQIVWYLEMIAEYTVYMNELMTEREGLIDEILAEIALQPLLEVRNTALAFMNARIANDELNRIAGEVYNQSRYEAYYDAWDDYVYGSLEYYTDVRIQLSTPAYFDASGRDDAIIEFNNFWFALSPEEQSMYAAALNAHIAQAEHYWNVLDPSARMMQFDPQVYASDGWTTLFEFINDRLNDAHNLQNEIADKQDMIARWNGEIAYLTDHGDEELLVFQAYLADPVKRQLLEDAILIVLDDAANLLAVADLEMIDKFITLATGRYEGYGMVVPDGEPGGIGIDLSAAAILGYTQEVSTILKALGSTITEAEFDTLITLAMDGFGLYVNSQEWMTEDDRAAMLAMIQGMIEKYLPIAFATCDVITDFLDSLTVEKIQVVLDQIAYLTFNSRVTSVGPSEGPSEIMMAIAIAKIVDALLYEGALDTDALIVTAIEVYYDFIADGPVDPAVKASVVAAFQMHIDQLILLAHELAGANPALLSPDDIAVMVELRQRIEFLGNVLRSGNLELILEPVTFGYQRWMFVELLWNFEWNEQWNDEVVVEAAITTVTQVFESSEEQSYYNLVAIMNLVKSAIESQDPEAILGAIDMLASIGFTDEEIATYLGNMPLAALTYMQFIEQYYYGENPYAVDLAEAERDLVDAIQALADMTALIDMHIAAMLDPDARALAQAFWDASRSKYDAYYIYQAAFEAGLANDQWDYYVYDDLEYYLGTSIFFVSNEAYDLPTSLSYRSQFNDNFAALSAEEQALYGPVLAVYETYYTINVNAYSIASDDFAIDLFYLVEGTDVDHYWAISDLIALYTNPLDLLQSATDAVAYYQALYDSYGGVDYSDFIDFFADPINDGLWNSITAAVVGEVDNITSNITPELIDLVSSFFMYQHLQDQINEMQWRIESLQWELNDCFTEAENAIALLDDPTSAEYAQAWWDVNVDDAQLWAEYHALIEAAWEDPRFNPDTYFYLESQTDNALREELENENPDGGVWYRDEVEYQLSWMTLEDAEFNRSLLAAYELYRADYYLFVIPAQIAYYGHRSNGESYDDQLQWAIDELSLSELELANILFFANDDIAMISDVDARAKAEAYWNWSKNETDAYLAYYFAISQAQESPSWNYEYFQYALLEPLQNSIYFNSYASGLYGYTDVSLAGWNSQQYHANLDLLQINNPADFALYAPVLDLFAIYYSLDQNQQTQAQNEFWNYYSGSASPADQSYMTNIDDYCSYQYQNILFAVAWAEQDVAYWQMMVDAAGESAWEYYYVDDLVWSYRDRLVQLGSFEHQLATSQDSINGLLDLTPAGLAGYAQTVAAFIGILGDSIDPIEASNLADFLYAVTALHLETSGLYTMDEQIALMAEIEDVFEYYIDGLLYAPDMLSVFLANLTADEIQTIMDAIATIDALDGIDPDLDNMIRAVAIADVMLAVAGDGFLDVDFLVEMAVYGYFDGSYHLHYDGALDIEARILLIQTLIDEILLQADVIDAYDPYLLTEAERLEVNEFHLLVEELMPYFQEGPEYEPIV
ncbi:MAG: hypothetical protein A2Y16_06335 [Tenericutes bacterium GWF2_57_13]|nr:MAG: hypothetical protein A2Y16_06335 [Tenericutes bacterium GWF2_57_13]